MSQPKPKTADARQRIIDAAERLFYAEGVRAVGIDRVIAEAGVAKMSLYNHFPSKDDLILAVLEHRAQTVQAMFSEGMERGRKQGLNPLQAFFVALKDWFSCPGFRGCAFINARVELADAGHEASQFAARFKAQFHELLGQIVAETAGKKAAATLAPAIGLLVEGAIVTAVMEQSPRAADVARDAALALLGPTKRKRA